MQFLLLSDQGFLLIHEKASQVLFFQFSQLGDSFLFSYYFLLCGFCQGLNLLKKILFFLLDRGKFKVDLLVISIIFFGKLLNFNIFVGKILL